MTKEKVVKALELARAYVLDDDSPELILEAIEIAMKDVSKSIPMKVILPDYCCPGCGHKLETTSASLNSDYKCLVSYCNLCGQAIRW